MNRKVNIIFCLFLFVCFSANGQIEHYNYKRKLQNVNGQWHKIVIPNEMFGKVSDDLSDIRIYGITSKRDTIEAPYILQLASEEISSNDVGFRLINQSRNEKGYYYTFEIPSKNPINQINLDFNKQNFDWRVKLEGSHNQQEWFTIVDNYRILSIKNALTNYRFTRLEFPDSKYHYYRLQIKSNRNPGFEKAKITLYEFIDGNYRDYNIKSIKTHEVKQAKQAIIDISLDQPVSVSCLKISISDTFDYYRTVTIKYITDSVKTEQGWKYDYHTLTSGTLNSIENNEFRCNSTILQKLRIVIHNHDNEPLAIESFKVKGYVHELLVRFTEPATYYLVYGNNYVGRPHYDIDRFVDKIPDSLAKLQLGVEQELEKEEISKTTPLFKNKVWLWLIMGVIILLLGWFSITIMRKE